MDLENSCSRMEGRGGSTPIPMPLILDRSKEGEGGGVSALLAGRRGEAFSGRLADVGGGFLRYDGGARFDKDFKQYRTYFRM